MSDSVLVAVIGGCFSVVVTLLEITRRSNNRDHKSNSGKLDLLADLVRDHLKGHP